MVTQRIYEDENIDHERDPEESPVASPRLVTQPYDLVVSSLLTQVRDGTIHLRQLSDRPKFQRRYVWSNRLASRLIESILLNVPIPPCYLAQDDDYALDVIDGQQRIFSVYRYTENQFVLIDLDVLKELNGKRFYELPSNLRRKIETYTLRCVIVTNDSDPDIRFEVFERLNTNTMPLNGQELRNSISRGALVDLLGKLALQKSWLSILNRARPDKRMRDEELILRYFAFYNFGLDGYSTPQKRWLNDMASTGRDYSEREINELTSLWEKTIRNCLTIFEPHECFRRLPLTKRQVINRALMDLTMYSLSNVPKSVVEGNAELFYRRYIELVNDGEFADLITRSIDHKSRTRRRFELWSERVMDGLF